MRICSGLKTPPHEIRQLTLIGPYVIARTMTLPNWTGVRLFWPAPCVCVCVCLLDYIIYDDKMAKSFHVIDILVSSTRYLIKFPSFRKGKGSHSVLVKTILRAINFFFFFVG